MSGLPWDWASAPRLLGLGDMVLGYIKVVSPQQLCKKTPRLAIGNLLALRARATGIGFALSSEEGDLAFERL
jgi:hypothetical protein